MIDYQATWASNKNVLYVSVQSARSRLESIEEQLVNPSALKTTDPLNITENYLPRHRAQFRLQRAGI